MASKDRRANGSAADDAEFEKLLDEMDELGRQADALRKKVNHLIDEMRENDVPPVEEVGEEVGDIAANGHDETRHITGEVENKNEAGDGDIALDTDNAAAGKSIDEDGEPETT